MLSAEHMLRVTAVAWRRSEDQFIEALDGGQGEPELVTREAKRHACACRVFECWASICGLGAAKVRREHG